MCQLTLINLHSKELNSLFLLTQFYENTRLSHKDGYGFFNGYAIHKSQLTPRNILNLGLYIKERVKDNSPILAHVRLATATNGVKNVSKENSHPFETDLLVLAHNGVLEFQDIKRMEEKKYEGMIDSEIFLHRLTEVYKKNLNDSFEDILRLTMSEFRGKFAFLIYNKVNASYYVVRGETAKLHISFVRPKGGDDNSWFGYVVNTDKEDLEKNSFYFAQLVQLTLGQDLEFSKIEELGQESIFLVKNDGLYRLLEIKETKIVKDVVQTKFFGTVINNVIEKPDDCFTRMLEMGLSIPEIDEIIYATLGCGILSLIAKDKEELDEVVKLLERTTTYGRKKAWEKIQQYEPDPLVIYREYGIQFPFMMNSISELKRTLKKARKTVEGKKISQEEIDSIVDGEFTELEKLDEPTVLDSEIEDEIESAYRLYGDL